MTTTNSTNDAARDAGQISTNAYCPWCHTPWLNHHPGCGATRERVEGMDKMRHALRTVVRLVGNVDHSQGHGANAAKMRGDLLNSIRDICKEAITP